MKVLHCLSKEYKHVGYVNKEILLVKALHHKVELANRAIKFSFQFKISIINKFFSGEESNTTV